MAINPYRAKFNALNASYERAAGRRAIQPKTSGQITKQQIEDLEGRIEALLRCNPETGEQWADICAIEDVIVAYRVQAA